MKIRKCTFEDLEVLLEISLKTFIDAFEKDNDPIDFEEYITAAFSKSTLTEQLNDPNSAFYFLYLDEELAGYFKLNEHDAQNELQSDDTMELERIYVLKEFQGQRFGAFMLEEAIRITGNKNKKQLWLGVWEENANAIRFYKKHGFTKFGTHPYYVGQDKQTDWLMRIEL